MTACPACGVEYDEAKATTKIEAGAGFEICYRKNGTFFVRQKKQAKRRRKTPPIADSEGTA